LHVEYVKQEYRHTIVIFNTYCLSTATVVTRQRHGVALHAHCCVVNHSAVVLKRGTGENPIHPK